MHEQGDLDPVVHVELLEQPGDVRLDRRDAEVQRLRLRVTLGESVPSPAWTNSIARTISAGGVSLSGKPAAPACSARRTSSSASKAVRTKTAERVPARVACGEELDGREAPVQRAGRPPARGRRRNARASARGTDYAGQAEWPLASFQPDEPAATVSGIRSREVEFEIMAKDHSCETDERGIADVGDVLIARSPSASPTPGRAADLRAHGRRSSAERVPQARRQAPPGPAARPHAGRIE